MGVCHTSENCGTEHVPVFRVQVTDTDDHGAQERTLETWLRLSHISLELQILPPPFAIYEILQVT